MEILLHVFMALVVIGLPAVIGLAVVTVLSIVFAVWDASVTGLGGKLS